MTNELQFQLNESVRESSYARYNAYHCDQCDMKVSMHRLAEHVAKKHRGLRFDAHLTPVRAVESSNTDDDGDADSMANSIGRNVASKGKSTKDPNFGKNGIGKQHRDVAAAVAAATVTPAPADAAVTQTSGDETDFHPFHANLSMKRGFLDDDNGDGGVSTSTPNARSTARSMARRSFYNVSASNDGTEAARNRRRRTIPTAHQLFDYSQNQSEFRASNFSNFGGGGAVDNGGDGGKARRHGSHAYRRQTTSVQRAPVIPENFEACPHCMSIMHQDYVRGHIERKHRSNVGATYESSVEAENNGNNFIPKASNNGNGAADGVDKSKNTNEPNFLRCQLCSAHMHTNYMPLHLGRKHRTEFDGSVGFIWTQWADNQVNQLLSSKRVHVKNGAFYFNDSE